MSVETPDYQENSVMELIVTNTGDQPIDVTIKIVFDDDSVLEIPVSYLLWGWHTPFFTVHFWHFDISNWEHQ